MVQNLLVGNTKKMEHRFKKNRESYKKILNYKKSLRLTEPVELIKVFMHLPICKF